MHVLIGVYRGTFLEGSRRVVSPSSRKLTSDRHGRERSESRGDPLPRTFPASGEWAATGERGTVVDEVQYEI
jgi:hypothetical protein